VSDPHVPVVLPCPFCARDIAPGMDAKDRRIAELEGQKVDLDRRVELTDSRRGAALWCLEKITLERNEAKEHIAELEAEREEFRLARHRDTAQILGRDVRIAELEHEARMERDRANEYARRVAELEGALKPFAAMPFNEEFTYTTFIGERGDIERAQRALKGGGE